MSDLTAKLIRKALDDELTGHDPIPMLGAALMSSRIDQGEAPPDELDNLNELLDDLDE